MKIDTRKLLIAAGKLLAMFCAALLIAAALPSYAEESAEEQGVQEIQQMLEQDIVGAYYYQAGQVVIGLRSDKAIREAERLLMSEEAYREAMNGSQPSK